MIFIDGELYGRWVLLALPKWLKRALRKDQV